MGGASAGRRDGKRGGMQGGMQAGKRAWKRAWKRFGWGGRHDRSAWRVGIGRGFRTTCSDRRRKTAGWRRLCLLAGSGHAARQRVSP